MTESTDGVRATHPDVEPGLLRWSRAIAVLQAPVVLPQGRRLRKATLKLPEAARPWTGERQGPNPIRLLVLGDSTAAGVGVETQDDALPGNLARVLADRTARGVEWRAVGHTGATSRDVIVQHLDEAIAEPADLVFVSIGANDALGLRSTRAFSSDLGRILGALSSASPDATILMSSLPVFARFDLLPDPLRTALFRHSRNLEAAARRVVSRDERWIITGTPPPYADGFFADDRFHPGATGYRDWADWAIDDAWDRGLSALATPR